MPDNRIQDTRQMLESASNEELAPLVGYIRKARFTQRLTSKQRYVDNVDDHRQYANEIYREICRFGGNSVANLYRGYGASYEDVVRDVAKLLKVKNRKKLSLIELESQIAQEVMRKAMKKASPEQREELEQAMRDAGMGREELRAFYAGRALKAVVGAQVYRAVMARVTYLVANALGRQFLGYGVSLAAKAAMSRAGATALGPVVGGVLLVGSIAHVASGPGYRVTVPCVLHITMLRHERIHKSSEDELEGEFADD